MKASDYIEVKNSTVHGMGLFAKQNISEGTIIAKIEGECINEDECVRREEEENNNYIFWYDDEKYIDVSGNILRYLNHHCDPKCYVDEYDQTSLCLIAAVDIKAGEELNIDYDYDEIYKFCNCSSCKSSQLIV